MTKGKACENDQNHLLEIERKVNQEIKSYDE